MKIKTPTDIKFKNYHSQLLKHLRLKGLQAKTIEAYERSLKRIYIYFNGNIENLTTNQMLDYFDQLLSSHSWSAVKLDLYGLRFFTLHILNKPWENVPLIKPPKTSRIPGIVTISQAQSIFSATKVLSYKVIFFTLYSMGLRLSEGINLKVSDIDGIRKRVHIRNAKGNKDRLIPISDLTLFVLRKFWLTHQHPEFIFPNRKKTRNKAYQATSPLDRGGVQKTLSLVVKSIGLKKKITPHSLRHSYATHLLESGVEINQLQKIMGHVSILTTVKYTHLTTTNTSNSFEKINVLMNGFSINWGKIK